jgi:DNA-binding transcriptional MerR regulator
MKMRDLEARTGVNRETIRVYLRHRLIPEPQRPKPNSADYDESHVRAIQAVRELQRESGLTLSQIKAALSGETPNRRVEAGAFQHLEELLAMRVGYEEQRAVTIDALRERDPHARRDAKVFAKLGLVTILDEGDGPQLSLTDAKLIEIWGRMRAAGFVEGAGFPPSILEYYRHASEYVAANEAMLFLDRTEGRIGEDEAAAMLQLALPLMLDFFGLLRLKAFMHNIHGATQEGRAVVIPSLPVGRGRARSKPKAM